MRHWILAGLLLLVGGAGRAEGPADRRAAAQRAAEDTIREVLPGPATFGAVAAFRQAAPRAVAVCGAVRVGTAPFLPFVAVVTYWNDEGEGGTVTPMVPTAGEGTARVAAEARARCHEGGGPPPRAANPPAPAREEEGPRPQDIRPERPAASGTLPPSPAGEPGPGGARRGDTVTARLAGTLRNGPGGGGSAIGTVRAGSSVTIHGTAPGGWYEVGDSSGPSGWVHGSRLFGTP